MSATRTIAFANQKGGVGKTTAAVNLADGLARCGRRVLLIDLDPQANASLALLGERALQLPATLFDALVTRRRRLSEVIVAAWAGVALAPSDVRLATAEVVLASARQRETTLRRCLVDLQPDYDYVLIDCPPSLGLLTINALTAADEVFIPVSMSYFALEGVAQLLQTVAMVRTELGRPDLAVSGVIANNYDQRTKVSQQILKALQNRFGPAVFQTVIKPNVRLNEAQSYHRSIFEFAALCEGANAYRRLTEEVIGRERIGAGDRPVAAGQQ